MAKITKEAKKEKLTAEIKAKQDELNILLKAEKEAAAKEEAKQNEKALKHFNKCVSTIAKKYGIPVHKLLDWVESAEAISLYKNH